jgi:hypothetical protein
MKKIFEERGDSMKILEHRTTDSKKEMDILDALDEVRHLNKRHANPDFDKMQEASNNKHNEGNDYLEQMMEKESQNINI